MRQLVCLAVLALCLIPMAGCDSEQPQGSDAQTMQVLIQAGNASAGLYDVWEQYYDANLDGIPDETDPMGNFLPQPVFVACRRAFQNGQPISGTGKTPWEYSLEISIIRAGTTTIERLTTTEALNSTFNMTPYSDEFATGAQPPGNDCLPPAVCNSIGRLLGTNRIVIDSTYDADPQDNMNLPVNFVDNLNRWDLACPGSPLLNGEPRMSGTLAAPLPSPFTMGLEKGDTILVKARKKIGEPNGVEVFSEPTLQGLVYLNGLQISNLTGTSVSPSDQAAGISFSFTVN